MDFLQSLLKTYPLNNKTSLLLLHRIFEQMLVIIIFKKSESNYNKASSFETKEAKERIEESKKKVALR